MSPAHAAGAASVVAQLLAFLREPTRHRPRFTGARASVEGGHHIFKFALGKFPAGLAHDMPTHEREELRHAAIAFIRAVCFREGATHYEMLCVPADAKHEAIKENYHLLMALIHPDRAEGAREKWPADWAQRANRAYAVLADDAARTSYDKGLGVFETIASRRQRPGVRPASGKVRLAKALLVLGAVVATLLLLEVWLAESAEEHIPFRDFARGRDVNASPERPRFLGASVVPARDTLPAWKDPESFTLLAPLWRGFSSAPPVETPPARVAAEARPVVRIGVPESEYPIPAGEASELASEAFDRSPMIVAQAPLPVPPAHDSRLTNAQIEVVVARLVGYYEAGEADKLMTLLDAKEAGIWQTARVRETYADFFRATRQRRLRLKNLEWQSASASAHAQGQATVEAEYFDAQGSVARDIEIDMEIALRDGQARITRLYLFPNTP